MRPKSKSSYSILQINALSFLCASILLSFAVSFLLYRSLGSSIKETTGNYAKAQAQQMGLSFKNFISNHQSILEGYSDFPIIKQAVVQPESHLEDAADLIKSFSFLEQKYPLILLDFEGIVLHQQNVNSKIISDIPKDLSRFLESDSSFHIGFFTSQNSKYLIFGTEVIVKDSAEGALLALIPVDSILSQNLTGTLEYELYFQDKILTPEINASQATYMHSTVEITKDFVFKTYVQTDKLMQSQIKVVYSLIFTIISIFFGFSILSIQLVKKHLLKPIISLKEMTQSISMGKSTLPIPEKSSIKELNFLQDDFKKMVSTLNDRTEALNDAKTNLENKVIQRTKELQNKAEELEKLSKYKSEFLARMSHEIRTPMNAIIGYVDILKESKLAEEDQKHLEIINNSADALLTIINDILDFSKIEAGMLQIEKTAFNLNIILDDIKNMFSKMADDKGIELTIANAPQNIKWLSGDPHRIRQILINLTGNALKFTKSGSVKVNILSKEQKDKVNLSINISDSGIGIPENKIHDIFNSFSQAEGSITRKFGGTGLGLPINRNLAELMGGTLTATSTLGHGSTFSLNLSLVKTEPLEKTTIIYKALNWQNAPKILLVEDNLVNQKLAMKTLDKLGCDITTAMNGKEAIEIITEKDFDLVLMDCQMPVLDGLETTRRLRKYPEFKEIPIIAFTANAMEDEIKECFAAGMNDYLTKPFKKEQFTEKLATWLKHMIKVA